MKIQMLITIDDNEPDEIIGMVPFRDKIIIATRVKLLMLDPDKETGIRIKELMRRGIRDPWIEEALY